MTRIRIAIAVVGLVLVAPAAAAKPKAPVSSFVDPTFGKVLSRTDKQVLYYWQAEKKAGGKVRCVGSCAKAWPPLIVKSREAGVEEDRRAERRLRHDPAARRQAPGDTEQAAGLHVCARAAAPGALRQRRRLVRRPPLGTTPRGPIGPLGRSGRVLRVTRPARAGRTSCPWDGRTGIRSGADVQAGLRRSRGRRPSTRAARAVRRAGRR